MYSFKFILIFNKPAKIGLECDFSIIGNLRETTLLTNRQLPNRYC